PDPSRSPPSRDSMPFRHSGAPAPPGPPCGTADRGALPADTRSPAEPPPPSCSAPLLPPARIQPPARTPSDSSLSAPFRPPLVRTENLEGDISIRHSRGHYRPSTTALPRANRRGFAVYRRDSPSRREESPVPGRRGRPSRLDAGEIDPDRVTKNGTAGSRPGN